MSLKLIRKNMICIPTNKEQIRFNYFIPRNTFCVLIWQKTAVARVIILNKFICNTCMNRYRIILLLFYLGEGKKSLIKGLKIYQINIIVDKEISKFNNRNIYIYIWCVRLYENINSISRNIITENRRFKTTCSVPELFVFPLG